jgi:LuxR family transcriptional regulator, quorum-sensing system regulator CviR
MERIKKPFPAKLFEEFSKRELQDFLEILHYSIEAETDDDVIHTLHLVKKLVPGQQLIAGVVQIDHRKGSHQFSKIVNISYHPNWIHRYLNNNYAEVDPVLLTHVNTVRTQVWSNAFKAASSKREKEFIEEAKSYGLTNGITTGRFEPKRSMASFFSFAGGAIDDNHHYAPALRCIADYLHHSLMKTTSSPAFNCINGLSPRELSVLNWMKHGKTNWEISRILGVSERTVRFHVEGIFSKLDVTSRTQAVAMAMENGLLTVS